MGHTLFGSAAQHMDSSPADCSCFELQRDSCWNIAVAALTVRFHAADKSGPDRMASLAQSLVDDTAAAARRRDLDCRSSPCSVYRFDTLVAAAER